MCDNFQSLNLIGTISSDHFFFSAMSAEFEFVNMNTLNYNQFGKIPTCGFGTVVVLIIKVDSKKIIYLFYTKESLHHAQTTCHYF